MKKSYLIVGQGIAGSCLGLQLENQGHTVNFIDNHHQNAASLVAAGLINPITGKRIVKSWNVDILLPYAINFYQKIAQDFQVNLVYPLNIIRLLHNQMEENDWESRTSIDDLKAYVVENEGNNWLENIKIPFSYGEITQSYRIDIGLLIKNYKNKLIHNNQIQFHTFDFQSITFNNNSVAYQKKVYDGIIFCEGAQMFANPFFNYLPLKPTKGEALFVNYPIEFPKIIKNKTAFVPIGKNEYWIGGTNDWNDQNNEPTLEKQTLMQQEWHELLYPNLFSIQNHRAAIRPATKDRFPFLGKHPEHPNLFIFNGFGTKATLLTPYLSNHFVDFLTKNTSLMQEVNCNRFN